MTRRAHRSAIPPRQPPDLGRTVSDSINSVPDPSSAQSPSLTPRGGGAAAFEVKFLLDESLADEVTRWANARLTRDIHASDEQGGAYSTTSLYTDTPESDVYFRSPKYKRRKFRVRRYGHEPWVFLERKNKAGDRVSKRRDKVLVDELERLAPTLAVTDWPGHWFHQRLLRRRLQPTCLISYERAAFYGSCAEGPLRLTMDRRVQGQLWDQWTVAPVTAGQPLLENQVILELKFRDALPQPFKQLVADLQLQPRPVSKYRRCREAFGVLPRPMSGPMSGPGDSLAERA